jgi:hypothetical protein
LIEGFGIGSRTQRARNFGFWQNELSFASFCALQTSKQETLGHRGFSESPLTIINGCRIRVAVKVFLSYSRADSNVAEAIALAIEAGGDRVFFDRQSVPKGAEFDARIRREIQACHLFVFLISSASLAQGGYSRTELKFAREKWPRPSGRILPVMVSPVIVDELPPFIRALNIMEPEGNLVAEVASEVGRIRGVRNRHRLRSSIAIVFLGFLAGVAAGLIGQGLGFLVQGRINEITFGMAVGSSCAAWLAALVFLVRRWRR